MSPPDSPVCGGCGGSIAVTDIGWIHLGGDGRALGWLCPEPHQSLAAPSVPAPPGRRPTPIPPLAYRRRVG